MTDHSSSDFMRAAVLGWPVEHSLSPRLHSYWLEEHKINGSYEKIAVAPEDSNTKIKELAALGYRGVNITVPHKETVMGLLDEIDPLAESVGAVNTVLIKSDGKLLGMNTDVHGFRENLRAHHVRLDNRKVAILGAGGAARAAVAALLAMGASEIRIINRSLDRSALLLKHFKRTCISNHAWDDRRALDDIALLVNTTPMGLDKKNPIRFSVEHLTEDVTVTDMVYTPLKTNFLTRAQNNGNGIIDGLGMLLHQAAPAFEAFFGVKPRVTQLLRDHVIAGMKHA